jgi:hypothetical protein
MDANLQREIEFAEAVAAGHRETASLLSKDQEALRTRLVQAADTIDILVARVKTFEMAARINHDTIVNREAS